MLKLRLSLLFPHLNLGGGETAMMDVAEALATRIDLRVGAIHLGSEGSADELQVELRHRFGKVDILERRWLLRPWLAKSDVVLWYGVNAAVPDALRRHDQGQGGRPTSVRVVHTERDEDGPAFHRRHGAQIDATICVSPTIARAIPDGIFVANACSRSFLQGTPMPLFSNRRTTLGFLGRLVPLKNVRWLVENLGRLDCNLAIQAIDTECETTADLRRLAEELGLAERVRFLPATRDVGTLLRSIDALVIVSRHEGFPRVVMEAGLVGTPVISTRVGALPELFPEEILFVDSKDGRPNPESMRQAVGRLEPARGEALRSRVEVLCDPESAAARYLKVMEDAHASRRYAGIGTPQGAKCSSTAS